MKDKTEIRTESQKTRRRLLAYLSGYKTQFALALFCMICFGATDGVVPFLIKHILDGIFVARDEALLYLFPIVLIAFALIRAAVDFGQQFLMSRVGHSIVRDLRNNINEHLLSLTPDYFVKNSVGSILSRITSDVMLVKTLLTDSVAAVLRDVVRIIALLIAAIYLDPWLALIGIIVFPICIIPVSKFGKRMRKLSKRGQDAIGTLSSMLQESVTGSRVVQVFGRERYEKDRFEEENERLTRTFVKSERVRALTGPVNEVIASFAVAGIILYGGYSVIGGLRSQGDFIAFIFALFLLYDPFKRLSRVHMQVQQGLSGAERIFEVLDTKPKVIDPEFPEALGSVNDVELKHVSFSYEGSARHALKDISLHIEENSKVALVGFSGAGKSTLIDLIPRFIDPGEGQVFVTGVDVSKARISDLRKRIALVGQHTFLFHDTIYANIAYGNPTATLESVEQAAKAAFAYDFIMQLPNGFQTIVGESGHSLSGGERQRVAIARAILKDAPILILDEATAALDNRAEREVQAAIEALERNRTSVVIAHRLSTVRNADKIIVLREGHIVEAGTHKELLEKEGEYSKLYALQFAQEEGVERVHEAVAN